MIEDLWKKAQDLLNEGRYADARDTYLAIETGACGQDPPNVRDGFRALGNALDCDEVWCRSATDAAYVQRVIRWYGLARRLCSSDPRWISKRVKSSILSPRLQIPLKIARRLTDWDLAETLLESALAVISTLHPDSEAGPLEAVLRSQLEMLEIDRLRSAEADPDPGLLAAAFERAALASQYHGEAPDRIRRRLELYAHQHTSDAAKYRAFAALHRTEKDIEHAMGPSFTDLERELSTAIREFDEGVAAARRAIRQAPPADRKGIAGHARYLAYWRWLAAEQLELVRGSKSRREEHVAAATSALERATMHAEKVLRFTPHDRFFENRFYSLDHLRLERVWIEALGALLRGDANEALGRLDDYCARFPADYEWSWWHTNAKVRQRTVRIAVECAAGRREDAARTLASLRRLLDSEPCGQGARALCAAAEYGVLKGDPRLILDELLSQFPILSRSDPSVPDEEQGGGLFAHLPPEVHRALREPDPGERADRALLLLAAGLIDHATSYPRRDDLLALLARPGEFAERFRSGCAEKERWLAEAGPPGRAFEELIRASPGIRSLPESDLAGLRELFERPREHWKSARLLLRPLIHRLPLVVTIGPPEESDGRRRWPVHPQGVRARRRFYFLSETELAFPAGTLWYLPSHYRSGSRTVVRFEQGVLPRPCHLPLRDATLSETAERAERRFEQLVRQYVAARFSAPVAGARLEKWGGSETDIVVVSPQGGLICACAFTDQAELGESRAREAVERLRERERKWAERHAGPVQKALVSNAPSPPELWRSLCETDPSWHAWRAELDQVPRVFAEGGEGLIQRLREWRAGDGWVEPRADLLGGRP